MIQCGLYEAVITPPIGSSIPGHSEERKVTGVKDELYVKAFVVESEGQIAALVVVDALYVLHADVQRIRERIHQWTSITPDQVMVSATHTHTGPPIRPGFDGSNHSSYRDYLVERSADAVIMAYRGRQPVRIGYGIGQVEDIAFNRRFFMKDGTVRTNPGFLLPELDRPAGPTDPEVLVVRIDTLDGRALGVITNFACHTDTMEGFETLISADFPGELSRTLKKLLGPDVVSMFVLGACGNINHYDFSKPKSIASDHYRIMGKILAGEVFKVRERMKLTDMHERFEIGISQLFFPLAYRMPTEEEVTEARRVMDSEKSLHKELYFAEHLLQMLVDPDKIAQVELQAFKLGELSIAGFPGEIFTEFGLAIKQNAPSRYTMINTLCNGSIQGYVCTKEAYVQGGYEPKLKRTHRIPSGAGDSFVDHMLQMLHQLHEG
jgi:neutral ceramidase